MSVLKLLRTDPTLRLIALALALMGALNASVFPYQSLIAIQRIGLSEGCLLYTSPSPRDRQKSRMPSSA